MLAHFGCVAFEFVVGVPIVACPGMLGQAVRDAGVAEAALRSMRSKPLYAFDSCRLGWGCKAYTLEGADRTRSAN